MNKYKNEEGKVAVLISTGYGAGWYSWNTRWKECLFDPDIVKLVLKFTKNDNENLELKNLIQAIAEQKWGEGFYTGGIFGLEVKWIDEGAKFQVDEYDGYESLKIKESEEWEVA